LSDGLPGARGGGAKKTGWAGKFFRELLWGGARSGGTGRKKGNRGGANMRREA